MADQPTPILTDDQARAIAEQHAHDMGGELVEWHLDGRLLAVRVMVPQDITVTIGPIGDHGEVAP